MATATAKHDALDDEMSGDDARAQKHQYMLKTYAKGSDAAKARGAKVSAARAITPAQTKMLETMFYDDAIQVGRDRTYYYLKAQHPTNHPSQAQVATWLLGQRSYQIDRGPQKTRLSGRGSSSLSI